MIDPNKNYVPEGGTGKVRVSVENPDEIVVLSFTAPGTTDEEHTKMAEETRAAFEVLVKDFPNNASHVLVDLTHAGIPSSKAREIYIKTLSDRRIKKTAFYGAGTAIKTIVSFIVSASGRGEEVKFFVNDGDARAWLRESK
jgi:hypothetical protein